MEFVFFPIDISYGTMSDRTVIYLFGRTQNNEQVCVIDDDFEPYFYVTPNDEDAKSFLIDFLKEYSVHHDGEILAVKDIEIVNKEYNGKEISAIKVKCYTQKGQNAISESLKSNKNIRDIFEARSEEHTSELQSHVNLVCRLLL